MQPFSETGIADTRLRLLANPEHRCGVAEHGSGETHSGQRGAPRRYSRGTSASLRCYPPSLLRRNKVLSGEIAPHPLPPTFGCPPKSALSPRNFQKSINQRVDPFLLGVIVGSREAGAARSVDLPSSLPDRLKLFSGPDLHSQSLLREPSLRQFQSPLLHARTPISCWRVNELKSVA